MPQLEKATGTDLGDTPTAPFDFARSALLAQLAELWSALRLFGPRGWTAAGIGAIATLVLIGIPSTIIENPFFVRMTPVRDQDYVLWILTGALAGLIVGTYALPVQTSNEGKSLSGGFLSFLAIGCPTCNKLIILLLGASGALNVFAPIQLYIGIASLALLGWALILRLRAMVRACPVPAGNLDRAKIDGLA